jgi:hypothetical protein
LFIGVGGGFGRRHLDSLAKSEKATEYGRPFWKFYADERTRTSTELLL